MTPFIIADVGSNHRGNLDLAIKAVRIAKDCGADAVKYQFYTHEELYGLPMPQPSQGDKVTGFQREWLEPVAKECELVGIEFMCTAFSPEGVDIVDPYVKRHKLASSEFSHVGIIDAMIKTGKPMIVSTGGVGDADVHWLHNYLWNQYSEGIEERVKLLECVAQYPAAPALYDVELLNHRGGTTTRPTKIIFDVHPSRFGTEAWHYRSAHGISDHTIGSAVACAAVGAGATIIENHLDPFPAEGSTPDSGFSANPTEFRMYVQDVREAASAVGNGIKARPGQHEYALRWARRYIATQPIKAGDAFRYGENFGIFRSLKDDTNGLSPITLPLQRLVEMKAKRAIEPGDSIGPSEIV